jgi:multidrug efflux system membrane fusion protein
VTAAEAEVRRGLTPGERVVTSGALRLAPGQAVVVSEDGGPVNPPAPGERRLRPRQAAEATP